MQSDQTLYDADFKYDRMNYRLNFDFDFTKTTKLSVSSGGYIGIGSNGGDASTSDGPKLMSGLYLQPPYVTPYIYPSWFVEHFPDPNNPEISDRVAGNIYTPGDHTAWYRHSYRGTTRTINDRFGIDLVLNQKLDFITPGLSFRANYSYNNYSAWTGGNIVYTGEFYIFSQTADSYTWERYIGSARNDDDVVKAPYQNPLRRGGNPSYDYVYGAQIDYNRQFGNHHITGLGLFERRVSQLGALFPKREEKWSGRVTYDYKTKYMVEATIGVSGSERFAPANRFGVFPSVAAGWNISKEELFKRYVPEQISNLKARYSYGETGNDNVDGFLYISEYTNYLGYNLGAPGTSQWINTVREGDVPNEKARWERAKKHNLGFDIGFFKNSLTFSAEFYSEHRDGILMGRKSLASWFGQSTKALNIGEVKRHGYELEASYFGTAGKHFNYWVKANFNFNENRITNQDDPLYANDYEKAAGKPIGTMYVYRHIGYYQDMDEIANYSLNQSKLISVGSDKLLDFDGDGQLNDKDRLPYKETTRPAYTFGLSSGFEYKNFEMSFLMQGVSSVSRSWGHTYAPLFANNPGDEVPYIKVKGRDDIWTPDNRNAEYAVWGGWSSDASTASLASAKYIRLKSLEVAYSFTGKALKSIGLSSARLALQGSNLLTWAPGFTMGDPENEAYGEYGSLNYPIPRRYVASIKINF